ncbi:MAG TPA: hypothetical protein DDX06_01015 [Curvibacter sp.]|nr:hypothetical protein [Curvibacter sp.]
MSTNELTQGQFQNIELPLIARSLTNPRKHFDAAKLQELADSVKASGVHQPVLVRPLPSWRQEDILREYAASATLPVFELVAGERRYRASQLAGMATIPAIVRDLTDAQVIEIQIIENLQRDGLTPLEEAEGYEALIQATGITKDELCAKVGKSRTYIFNRFKLLDLCQEAKAALREGKLDASRAELIARIPDQKLQLKALKALTETFGDGGELRLSYRSAKIWLEQNVMLRLERAVFDIKDAKLCSDKPACTDCQLRTGANPDLFSDVDSPDVCTDPPCFHAKEAAHHAQVVAKARKTGMQVIEGEEAEKVMPNSHFIIGYEKVENHIYDPRTGGQTPRHMLLEEFFDKAKIKDATRLIICPHTQKSIKVVTEELAGELDDLLDQAAAKGKGTPKEDKAHAKARLQAEEERKRHELAKKYETTWRTRTLEALRPQLLAGVVSAFQPEVLRTLLTYLCLSDVYDFEEAIALALDLTPDDPAHGDTDALEKAIQAIPDTELGSRICIYIACKQASDIEQWNDNQRVITPAPALISLANSAGLDAAAIQAQVQEEMREELGVQPKAKGKKSASPNDPAAQPTTSPPAAAASPAKSKKKAAKLSPEEAQRGIAVAMQSEEAAASSGAAEAGQQGEAAAGAEA